MTVSTDPKHGVRVTASGLKKSFERVQVLKGIDLDIAAGEIFVIMGPSGSGKSVLLRQIIGLDTPDEGEIQIEGKPVRLGTIMNRIRLAIVFQSGALLNSLTVGENVGLYLSEHRLKTPPEIDRIVGEKLDLVGLRGIELRHPGELSGGERKRVAIARALAIDPQLILYDEPTSELDPIMAVTIAEEILKLKHRMGLTSIVVSHDRDLAFGVADRIAIMHAGSILCTGTPNEIRDSKDPIVQRFLTVELKREGERVL
ncbi:MAG: ATP-binding cassette domain-containing protein [Verrucomicrobia bacterium]|nr:ATP-binding cassette domain-containing protein [Verrucomicrobiota bacterium]